MNMGKTSVTGYQIVYGILVLAGCISFLWFFWPLIFKRILNAGNLCGMAGSAVIIYYGICHRAVHQCIAGLWQSLPARIVIVLLAAASFAALVLLAAAAVVIIGASSKEIPDHTPAVVLGCSVKGTVPSRVLRERIDAAYTYLEEHPQAVCVLSGGQGRGEDISEAACMYQELIKAGVDADRLYQEPESVNTQENLENSHKILEQLGRSEAVTVISSEFHLYRGRWWASKLGYENFGYGARTDWKYLPTFFLREMIAVVHLWIS